MNVTMSVLFGCIYIVFALAVAVAFSRRFRQNERRGDPFIVCRACSMRGECRVPVNPSGCASLNVEDSVRAVLDGIPQFKDI